MIMNCMIFIKGKKSHIQCVFYLKYFQLHNFEGYKSNYIKLCCCRVHRKPLKLHVLADDVSLWKYEMYYSVNNFLGIGGNTYTVPLFVFIKSFILFSCTFHQKKSLEKLLYFAKQWCSTKLIIYGMPKPSNQTIHTFFVDIMLNSIANGIQKLSTVVCAWSWFLSILLFSYFVRFVGF